MIRCEHDDCAAPAVARLTGPTIPHPAAGGLGFAIVRPITTPAGLGVAACADHTVRTVLLMLMNALPEAGR